MYNATDATKIPLREKPVKVEKEEKPKLKRGRPKKGEKREPIEPSKLELQKEMKTTDEMLSLVSTNCGVGVKQNSKGNREVWITKESSLKRPLFATFGGKLHISVVDGDIPVTAFYSGANVHDSSVALPLMKETSKRVTYLYDLQDAGYYSKIIEEYSKKLNHRPIIDINPGRSKVLKEQIQLQKEEKKKFKFFNLQQSSDIHHYNQRSMVERVNKYLKDDFGCNTIYYQGATKVASVLAFAILSICINQSLKLIT
jgi:hypothetical protein